MNGPIDFYEDEGALLAATVPRGDLPEIVKTARYAAEDDADTFALVLLDEHGAARRLFSLVDPGNTALSAHYLLHQSDALPEGAVKTAALNIGARLRGLQMEIPGELCALAGVDSAEGLVTVPSVVKQAGYSLPMSADGRVQLQTASGAKVTSGQPTRYSGPAVAATAPKTPGLGQAMSKMASLEEVITAVDRFGAEYRNYAPATRQAVAQLIKTAANQVAVQVGPAIDLYADGVFDLGTALLAIDARHILAPEGEYGDLAKVASMMSEREIQETLEGMDLHYGLDRFWDTRIPDPYAATRVTKTAELLEGVATSTSGAAVQRLALEGRELVLQYFDAHMVDSFQKNPITVFKALPDPQRELLARLAQSHSEG